MGITTGINSKDQNEDDTTISKKTSDTANKDQYVINLVFSLGKLVTSKSINPMKAADAFVVCYNKYKFDQQQKRLQLVTATDEKTDCENNDDLISVEDSSSIPSLSAAGIPCLLYSRMPKIYLVSSRTTYKNRRELNHVL